MSTTNQKKRKVDETMVAPTVAPAADEIEPAKDVAPGLDSVADDGLRTVLDFLDVRSVGRLSCINRQFRKKLDSQNLFWFSRAQKIAQGDGDDDDDVSPGDGNLATCGAILSEVDWKKVVSIYSATNSQPMTFKESLTDFVLMLAAREVNTKVQCTGTTSLKPEFYIPGAGMRLSLPLDPTKLRALIDGGHCEQAPVGRGPETVVDIETRNTWRLMLGKDVTIGSKAWNSELTRAGFNVDGILHKIQEKLMPHLFGAGDVWAQPYSMLIYEKGSFFKPHRDTLRGPNHFGSLSILLPVQGGCTGGDFRLTHNSVSGVEPKEVATYSPPQHHNECVYVAFYTDVFHEVQPITAGYRVSLTYHLWAVPKTDGMSMPVPRPVPQQRNPSIETMLKTIFEKTLQEHFKIYGEDNRYVFALDHSYGSRNLSPWNLRGRDKHHYNAFQHVNEVDVSLEHLCVETFHKPEDVTEYKDLQLVICENEEERKDSDRASDQTVWLNQERFLSMDHEFSEYQYYTGNEGYATGLQYEHACIVIQSGNFELKTDY